MKTNSLKIPRPFTPTSLFSFAVLKKTIKQSAKILRPSPHYAGVTLKRCWRGLPVKMSFFKNASITSHSRLVFEENSVREITRLSWRPSFRKALPSFSTSSGLKSVVEKLCFRDGLVRTVGLTIEKSCVFKFLPLSVDTALFVHGSELINVLAVVSLKERHGWCWLLRRKCFAQSD